MVGGGDGGELKLALERLRTIDRSQMSDYHKKLLEWTRNVDKRYAWVILVSLWLMMAAVLGPYRIYGLIFAKVTSEGIYTREEASWPVSMIFTVENVVGPFVSVVVYYFSFRQSMLMGYFLLVIGNGLASISNSLLLDVILLGFVQGIGYSCIFMPFMEIINHYFLKYRNMALGIALSGGTLSIFGWSPIFQYLLNNYPWRYSYFGIACISCIGLALLPLLRPNPKPTARKESQENEGLKNSRSSLARISMRALTYQNSSRRQSTILIARKIPREGIQRNASIISVNPFANSVGLERKISRTINDGLTKAPAVKNPIVAEFKQKNADDFETVSISEVAESSDFTMSVIWDILKTPAFHMIWYNELVYYWVFSIYVLVMVDYALDRGCTKEQADSMLICQSIGELLGRLVLTALVDMRLLSSKNTTILTLFILASLMITVTQVTGYMMMAGMTVSISAISSLLYILLNGLLVDYLGENQVTLGYGMASCIGGILLTFRPQAVGYFRDYQGTYDPLMICIGVSCAIGGVLWTIEPVLARLCKNPSSKSEPSHGIRNA